MLENKTSIELDLFKNGMLENFWENFIVRLQKEFMLDPSDINYVGKFRKIRDEILTTFHCKIIEFPRFYLIFEHEEDLVLFRLSYGW
jgi:hypothetical protein